MVANSRRGCDSRNMKPSTARSTAFEMSSESWDEYAACSQKDPELFFPPVEMKGHRPSDIARQAIAVCNNECEVRDQCLRYALKNNERNGIWGGMTTKQRDEYARRLNRTRSIL